MRVGESQVSEISATEHLDDANKCWTDGKQAGRLRTLHCNILKEFIGLVKVKIKIILRR